MTYGLADPDPVPEPKIEPPKEIHIKELPIYPQSSESFHGIPNSISVNSTQDKLLVAGNNMLKLFDITKEMKITVSEKGLPERARCISKSIIKDIIWCPCIF